MSAPTRLNLNGKNCIRSEGVPVIRTHIERPQNAMLQIKVDSVVNSVSFLFLCFYFKPLFFASHY